MILSSHYQRWLAVFCAWLLFFTNVLGLHAAESNFWKDRLVTQKKKVFLASANILPSEGPGFPAAGHLSGLSRGDIKKSIKPKRSESDGFKELVARLSEHGIVQRVIDSSPTSPVIVLIQDIHGEKEAQKNISTLIQTGLEFNPTASIGLEGSVGKIDIDQFRNQDASINLEAGSFLFNAGLIEGPELGLLTADKLPSVFGLEDKTLYLENIEAVKTSLLRQKPLLASLQKQVEENQQNKEKFYSSALKEFDNGVGQFEKGTLSLGQFLTNLTSQQTVSSVEVPPAIALFLNSYKLESHIDFSKADLQRKNFISRLAQRLNKEDLNKFLERSHELQKGRTRYSDYQMYLEETAATYKVSLNEYPEFANYIRYVLQSDALDPALLFKEINSYQNSVFNHLIKNEQQRNIHTVSRHLQTVSKLVQLELTTDEWLDYKTNKQALVEGLAQVSDEALSSFEKFYESATQRDGYFVKQALEQLHQSKPFNQFPSMGILVAGGFHRKGIEEILSQKNIRLVTVAPKIKNLQSKEDRAYLSIFTRGKNPLDSIFKSQKISLVKSPRIADAQDPLRTQSFSALVNGVHLSLERHMNGVVSGASAAKKRLSRYFKNGGELTTEGGSTNLSLRPLDSSSQIGLRISVGSTSGHASVHGESASGLHIDVEPLGLDFKSGVIEQVKQYWISLTGRSRLGIAAAALVFGAAVSLTAWNSIWGIYVLFPIIAASINQPRDMTPVFFRLPRVINGKGTTAIFRKYLSEEIIAEGVPLENASEDLSNAVAGALSEILDRRIKPEQVQFLFSVYQDLNARVSNKNVKEARGKIKDRLQNKYEDTIKDFFRMYGSLKTDIEVIRELILRAHLERLLGNPVRLATKEGKVYELDPEVQKIISSIGIVEPLKALTPYYDAKKEFLAALATLDSGDLKIIRAALSPMKKAAAAFSKQNFKEGVLAAARAYLSSENLYPEEGVLGEWQEIINATAPPLSEDQMNLIDKWSKKFAYYFYSGQAAERLVQTTKDRTKILSLDDLAPAVLDGLPPENIKVSIVDMVLNFSWADTRKAWALTYLPQRKGQFSEMRVKRTDNLVAYAASFAHEAVHFYAEMGLIPIMPEHEAITHAVTADVLVDEGGEKALLEFGDVLYLKIFQQGQKDFDKKNNIFDFPWLLKDTQQLVTEILSSSEFESVDRPKESHGREKGAREQYFDFERLVGTRLGGYGYQQRQIRQLDSLKFYLDYASFVLSRNEISMAPLQASQANQERISLLREQLSSFARTITRNEKLELVDWEEPWRIGDLPQVRVEFDSKNRDTITKIIVPNSVWFMDEKIATGLIYQEIFRALYANPASITKDLSADPIFMELWRAADTPRVIKEGTTLMPGTADEIKRLYTYRHLINDMDLAEKKMKEQPLPFQYLAGLFWFWDMNSRGLNDKELDPRIKDERVIKALSNSKNDLLAVFNAQSAEDHYNKLVEKIWPVVQGLTAAAVEDGVFNHVLNSMADKSQPDLTEDQQALHESGELGVDDLSAYQAEEVSTQLALMSEAELDAIRKQVMAEFEKQAAVYQEQLGTQPFAGMNINEVVEQRKNQPDTSGSINHFNPMFPNFLGGGLDYQQALKTLKELSEELQKLFETFNQSAESVKKEVASRGGGEGDSSELEQMPGVMTNQLAGLLPKISTMHSLIEQVNERIKPGAKQPLTYEELLKLADLTDELTSDFSAVQNLSGDIVDKSKPFESIHSEAQDLLIDAADMKKYMDQINKMVQALAQPPKPQSGGDPSPQGPTAGQPVPFKMGGGQGGVPGMGIPGQHGQIMPGGGNFSGKFDREGNPLQTMTFDKIASGQKDGNAPGQSNRATAMGAGAKGYGEGMSDELKVSGNEPTDTNKAFKPASDSKKPDDLKSHFERPAEKARPADMSEARKLLRQIPAAPKNPNSISGAPVVETARTKFEAAVLRPYGAAIKGLRNEFKAMLEETIAEGKLSGLDQGDYLDPELISQAEFNRHLMAVDIVPEGYDKRASIVIDVSGSMLMKTADGGRTYLDAAAEGGLMFLSATSDIPGVDNELVIFSDQQKILKRFGQKVNGTDHLAQVYSRIFQYSGAGTADVAAILYALQRISEGRELYPGLRIYGLGIGEGMAKVEEAYGPGYGVKIPDPTAIPDFIRTIVRKELAGVGNNVNNLIIVLTDGNPGAHNAAAIQELSRSNRSQWDYSSFQFSANQTSFGLPHNPAHMSVLNSFLSAAFWGWVLMRAAPEWMAIVAASFFAIQGLILIYFGFRADQKNDLGSKFYRWFWKGGVVADNEKGVHQPFKRSMPPIFTQWVNLHEQAENAVAQAVQLLKIPVMGPLLNHLLASLTDPLTLGSVIVSQTIKKIRFFALKHNHIIGFLYIPMTHVEGVWNYLISLLLIPTAQLITFLMLGILLFINPMAAAIFAAIVFTLPTETKNVGFNLYEKRVVDGMVKDVLVIDNLPFPIGAGGKLTPKVTIKSVKEYGLYPPEHETTDEFPAEFVAELVLDGKGDEEKILIPLSPYNMDKLADMIEIMTSTIRPNLYLRGPAGSGKNTLLYLLAGLANYPIYLMSLNFNTTNRQLIATQTYNEDGDKSTQSKPSGMVQASQVTGGAIGAADEVNKPANPGILSSLYSLLQNRFVTMPNGEVLQADGGFKAVALGNPDHPPYIVSQVPVDFQRRHSTVDFDYLYAPQRPWETPEDEFKRRKEMEFMLRLNAKEFYRSSPQFVRALVLLGQDIVEAFEKNGLLPRPLSTRGLFDIIRHLEKYPEDITRFAAIFSSVYNIHRLDPSEYDRLERLVKARMGNVVHRDGLSQKWMDEHIPLRSSIKNIEGDDYYQIRSPDKVLVQEKIRKDVKSNIGPQERVADHQTNLRTKLALLKLIKMKKHILTFGHTGMGKTTVVLDLLENDLKMGPFHMQLDSHSNVGDLWGQQTMKSGKTVWEDSPLIKAMKSGRPVVIDDIGKPRNQAVVSILNNVLQFGQILTPYGIVNAENGFFIIANTTPEEARYRAHPLSGEVEDRFSKLYFTWLKEGEEVKELQDKFPTAPKQVIQRLVTAAGQLRMLEAQKGEFMRPVSLQDLKDTIDRFIRRPSKTLFTIFLSAYSINPTGDYVRSIKDVFDDYNLTDERYQNYKHPPTIDEILSKPTPQEKFDVITHLVQSFVGANGNSNFHVNRVNSHASVKIMRKISLGGSYIIEAGDAIGPIVFVNSMKDNRIFSEEERKTLMELSAKLSQMPLVPNTGDIYIDKLLATLAANAASNLFIAESALENLTKRISKDGLPTSEAELSNFIVILRWFEEFEIIIPELKQKLEAFSAQISNLLDKTRDNLGNPPLPLTTSLIGLDPAAEAGVDPIIVKAIPKEPVLDRILEEISEMDASLAKLFGANKFLSTQSEIFYYADFMPSYALLEMKNGQPIFMVDEVMASVTISPENEKAWYQLMALLFAHEFVQYFIRKGETRSSDLTEEAALFAEVDRLLWTQLNDGQQKSLMDLADLLDRSESSRPDRLRPSLVRLNVFKKSKSIQDWEKLAQELANTAIYKGQELDLDRFESLRQNIRGSLKKPEKEKIIENEPEPTITPIEEPAMADIFEFFNSGALNSETIKNVNISRNPKDGNKFVVTLKIKPLKSPEGETGFSKKVNARSPAELMAVTAEIIQSTLISAGDDGLSEDSLHAVYDKLNAAHLQGIQKYGRLDSRAALLQALVELEYGLADSIIKDMGKNSNGEPLYELLDFPLIHFDQINPGDIILVGNAGKFEFIEAKDISGEKIEGENLIDSAKVEVKFNNLRGVRRVAAVEEFTNIQKEKGLGLAPGPIKDAIKFIESLVLNTESGRYVYRIKVQVFSSEKTLRGFLRKSGQKMGKSTQGEFVGTLFEKGRFRSYDKKRKNDETGRIDLTFLTHQNVDNPYDLINALRNELQYRTLQKYELSQKAHNTLLEKLADITLQTSAPPPKYNPTMGRRLPEPSQPRHDRAFDSQVEDLITLEGTMRRYDKKLKDEDKNRAGRQSLDHLKDLLSGGNNSIDLSDYNPDHPDGGSLLQFSAYRLYLSWLMELPLFLLVADFLIPNSLETSLRIILLSLTAALSMYIAHPLSWELIYKKGREAFKNSDLIKLSIGLFFVGLPVFGLGVFHPISILFIFIHTVYHRKMNIRVDQERTTDRAMLDQLVNDILQQDLLPQELANGQSLLEAMNKHWMKQSIKEAGPSQILQIDPIIESNEQAVDILLRHILSRVAHLKSSPQVKDVLLINQQMSEAEARQALTAALGNRPMPDEVNTYLQNTPLLMVTGQLNPDLVVNAAKQKLSIPGSLKFKMNIFTTSAGKWNLTQYDPTKPDQYDWSLFQILSDLGVIPIMQSIGEVLKTHRTALINA